MEGLTASARWVRAGVTWVFATVFFGLLPLWIRALGVFLNATPQVGWDEVLKEGIFIFFSMAIVAAITTDYHLVSKNYYPKYAHIYMMELFPVILYLLALAVYFWIQTSQTGQTEPALRLEIIIVLVSCIYAFIHKAIQITQAEKRNVAILLCT